MITKINGSTYLELMHSGIKYLDLHRDVLNDLNVFPVPDGDTGTNMSMTLKSGYDATKDVIAPLNDISRAFSQATVFGARGNSGVILSQFIKGISESFKGHDEADADLLSRALKNGCVYAYSSVAKPAEGTMLTVIKDASNHLAKSLPLSSIDEAIDIFLDEAKKSLNNTPELLPILKKAGVVDSGGSGIVYFFEGIKKYLAGEKIEASADNSQSSIIDLSIFDKNTDFEYGYCVEGLAQLKIDVMDFDIETLKKRLALIGNSIVVSLEKDKLKMHVHTKDLGTLMSCIQNIGEFLTVKIDNMTVQNMQNKTDVKKERKFLYSEDGVQSNFSVVAVATNSLMQEKFFEMGADVVIMSEVAPSSQDFLDSFKYVKSDQILVFPNSSNSLLASMQAGSMYRKAKVTVLNSRSPVECYASLPLIDFEEDVDNAVLAVNDTISSLYQVSIYHAQKDIKYGSRHISKNDFFALADNKILNISATLGDAVTETVAQALNKNDYSIVTLFYGKSVSEDYLDLLTDNLYKLGLDIEIARVPTYETIYCISIAFE